MAALPADCLPNSGTHVISFLLSMERYVYCMNIPTLSDVVFMSTSLW